MGVDVAKDDVFQNFCGKSDIAMNDDKPWQDPHEKVHLFMQMLI